MDTIFGRVAVTPSTMIDIPNQTLPLNQCIFRFGVAEHRFGFAAAWPPPLTTIGKLTPIGDTSATSIGNLLKSRISIASLRLSAFA